MARLVWPLLVVLLGGLAGCGQAAEPKAHVREESAPAGERGVCSPLPRGLLAGMPNAVALNGVYVDAAGKNRGSLHLHLAEPADAVRAELETRLRARGFTAEGAPPGERGAADGEEVVWLAKDRYGSFGYRVGDIPGTGPDSPVRTLLEVDTPGRPHPRRTHPQCRAPGPVTWSTLPRGDG